MVAVDSESRRTRGSRWCNSRACFTLGISSLLYFAYQAVWTFWLPGIGIEDSFLDEHDGHTVYRRKQDRLYKVHHDEKIPITPFDGVLEGHLTLVDLTMNRVHVSANDSFYAGVEGVFCHISWEKQAKAPWEVPMFKDLQQKSILCQSTMHVLDLQETILAIRQYDAKNHTFAAVEHKHSQGSSPPTLVVFHESRCGSTLVANTLSVIGRVFSESPPPINALLACERYNICGNVQLQLIRDVFYLMGRATKPQKVSYKIQSIGSRELYTFRAAMPGIPWMFVYRDGVEVLMSHFQHYQEGKNSAKYLPNCLRTWKQKAQHPKLQALVQSVGRTMTNLTSEEYCAAHLASLAASALAQHSETSLSSSSVSHHVPNVIGGVSSNNGHGYYVNYNQLPHILWEQVLNDLLVGGVSKHQRLRMSDVAKHYSKQRDEDSHWQEDVTLKQGRAPQSVKDASALFLNPLYYQLEAIRVGSGADF